MRGGFSEDFENAGKREPVAFTAFRGRQRPTRRRAVGDHQLQEVGQQRAATVGEAARFFVVFRQRQHVIADQLRRPYPPLVWNAQAAQQRVGELGPEFVVTVKVIVTSAVVKGFGRGFANVVEQRRPA